MSSTKIDFNEEDNTGNIFIHRRQLTNERSPMLRILNATSVIAIMGIAACGSSPGPDYNYGMTGYDAPPPSPATSDGALTLTVMNYFSWCSVSINGGAASTSATVSASVTTGSLATIIAAPAGSGFEIGADPWFGVDENDGGPAAGTDTGNGTSETSQATVTVASTGEAQCVAVCCQEPGNSPLPCPTTNPCL